MPGTALTIDAALANADADITRINSTASITFDDPDDDEDDEDEDPVEAGEKGEDA